MFQPVFRFAPSPNGYLHIGHAYSALLNQKICQSLGGNMLLRIEDTDQGRSRQEYVEAIIEDLEWIGFEWEDEIRFQSGHLGDYQQVIDQWLDQGLAYVSVLSRRQIHDGIRIWEQKHARSWPRDPDGAPHYPGEERQLGRVEQKFLAEQNTNHAIRLNLAKAIEVLDEQSKEALIWREVDILTGNSRSIRAEPDNWGDIVLGRRDIPASYHLACVMDDAAQGVTHIVRGMDIFNATSLHRLIQELLGYNEPIYAHHELILDKEGQKYSKSQNHQSLRDLRQSGMSADDVLELIGVNRINVDSPV